MRTLIFLIKRQKHLFVRTVRLYFKLHISSEIYVKLRDERLKRSIIGNYNFKQDLPQSKKGEQLVIDYYTQLGYRLLSSNDTNSHDLLFCLESEGSENIPFTVEVKSDSFPRLANLCIEFECRGKLSGISVTQADYYAYVFNTNVKEIWIIKTKSLKSILHLNHKISTGGDKGSNTKMYLLDREKVRKYFTVKVL